MRPQDLIQAFSRTNRIFDSKKRYGHIITFQRPEAFKEAVDNALKLYSNGGENDVTAPDWAEEKANFIQAWIDFQVKVEDVENYVITIEQASSPQLRRIAKEKTMVMIISLISTTNWNPSKSTRLTMLTS